jgi:hypothetical protein
MKTGSYLHANLPCSNTKFINILALTLNGKRVVVRKKLRNSAELLA